MVICATMGRSQSDRTARSASWISSTSEKVSRMKPSTPPSRRPVACALKCSNASIREVGPKGSSRMPSGPIAPTTLARSPAASRASAAARLLMAWVCSARP